MKPINLVHEAGVVLAEVAIVVEAIRDLVMLADLRESVTIRPFGTWRHPDFRNPDGTLRAYYSVDWYVAHARLTSERSGQLNAQTLIRDLREEPWQQAESHFDVCVLKTDLYGGRPDSNFAIGIGYPDLGMVISTHRFRTMPSQTGRECFKTVAMHELGHMFGLPNEGRIHNVHQCLGLHCANRCIMRQGLRLTTDWINHTADRLAYGPLCPQCQSDLRAFFRRH